jgi:hypothetical protein
MRICVGFSTTWNLRRSCCSSKTLNLVRSGNVQDQQLTFNIRISTYLRGQQLQSSGAVTLMNRISKNQGMLLAVLVVLWLGLLMWQFGYSTEQERVPLTHVKRTAATVGKALQRPSPRLRNLQVHLDRLAAIKGQREATFSTPRNIFASLMPSVSTLVRAPKPQPKRRRAPKCSRKRIHLDYGSSSSPAGEFPGTLPFEEQVTSEESPEGESSEGEAVVEGPTGSDPGGGGAAAHRDGVEPLSVCRVYGGGRRFAEEAQYGRGRSRTTKCTWCRSVK